MNIPKDLHSYGVALKTISNLNNDNALNAESLMSSMRGLNQEYISNIAVKNKDILLSKAITQSSLETLLSTNGLTEAQAAQTAQEVLSAQAKTANTAASKILTNTMFQEAVTKTKLTALGKDEVATEIQNILVSGTKNKLDKDEIATQITKVLVQENVNSKVAKNTAENIVNAASQKGLLASIKATTTALWTQAAAWAATPMGMATIAVGSIYVLSSAYGHFNKKLQDSVDAARESAKSFSDTTKSLSDYKAKIIDLKTALDSGNLSQTESYDKRKELLTIQNELIDKYGKEAGAIDIVTGSIDAQNDAINNLFSSIERNEYNKFKRENQVGINEAVKYFTEDVDMINDWETQIEQFYRVWSSGFKDLFKEEVENLGGTFADALLSSAKIVSFAGTKDEILSKYEDLFDSISKLSQEFEGEDKLSADNILGDLSKVINSRKSELQRYNETYKQFIEGRIKFESDFNDEYLNILQKRESLQEAQLTGDIGAITKAQLEAINAFNLAITESMNDTQINRYFQDMFDSFKESHQNIQFEIDLSLNTNNLEREINHITQWFTENNFDDLAVLSISADDTSTAGIFYKKLEEYANTYGKTIDELINKLVLLGKLESAPKVEDDSFAKTLENLTNKTTLLSTAMA